MTDTETEATPTSSPLKHLSGHNRLSRNHRTGYSSHDESLELSDVFPSGHLPSLPSPPPRVDLADEESRSSMSAADIGQIRDVLITATEDFGPMGGKALQTTDQDQGKIVFKLIVKNVCYVVESWEHLFVSDVLRFTCPPEESESDEFPLDGPVAWRYICINSLELKICVSQ